MEVGTIQTSRDLTACFRFFGSRFGLVDILEQLSSLEHPGEDNGHKKRRALGPPEDRSVALVKIVFPNIHSVPPYRLRAYDIGERSPTILSRGLIMHYCAFTNLWSIPEWTMKGVILDKFDLKPLLDTEYRGFFAYIRSLNDLESLAYMQYMMPREPGIWYFNTKTREFEPIQRPAIQSAQHLQ